MNGGTAAKYIFYQGTSSTTSAASAMATVTTSTYTWTPPFVSADAARFVFCQIETTDGLVSTLTPGAAVTVTKPVIAAGQEETFVTNLISAVPTLSANPTAAEVAAATNAISNAASAIAGLKSSMSAAAATTMVKNLATSLTGVTSKKTTFSEQEKETFANVASSLMSGLDLTTPTTASADTKAALTSMLTVASSLVSKPPVSDKAADALKAVIEGATKVFGAAASNRRMSAQATQAEIQTLSSTWQTLMNLARGTVFNGVRDAGSVWTQTASTYEIQGVWDAESNLNTYLTSTGSNRYEYAGSQITFTASSTPAVKLGYATIKFLGTSMRQYTGQTVQNPTFGFGLFSDVADLVTRETTVQIENVVAGSQLRYWQKDTTGGNTGGWVTDGCTQDTVLNAKATCATSAIEPMNPMEYGAVLTTSSSGTRALGDNTDDDWKIGAGIGVGVGVLFLCIVGFLVWKFCCNQDKGTGSNEPFQGNGV
jgi:hypothetical protein